MVCILVKSGLFGRSRNLASSEVSSKLHVSQKQQAVKGNGLVCTYVCVHLCGVLVCVCMYIYGCVV